MSSDNINIIFDPIAPRIKIFCDFDGTIMLEDIGDKFFEAFGGEEIWNDIKRYEKGEITSQELYRIEASRIHHLTMEKIDEFCQEKEIDPTFLTFIKWCEENEIFICVVSDGLDVYVHRIFHRYNIRIQVYCNTLVIHDDGTALPEYPYTDEDCDCCANCKRDHLLTLSADDDIIVMIGDGYSDRCPVKYADIVFAKGSLETFCQHENISFTSFRTFDDVKKKLESVISKKKFRKPKQPELRRKAVWRQE